MLGSGRSTGIVLEVGDGITQIVPVYDSYPIPHAISKVKLAGNDVADYFLKLLRSDCDEFSTAVQRNIIRDVKERFAYVARDFDSEVQRAAASTECQMPYPLPNDAELTLSHERFRCPELLFRPDFNEFDFDGIDQSLFYAIKKCPFVYQKELYRNIVLSGGGTMFEGFPERIEREIVKLAPPTMEIKVIAPANRKFGAWIGGSVLSSLSTFPQLVVGRVEYDDVGSEIIHRKCI
jgi:actin